MIRLRKLFAAISVILILTFAVFAQSGNLPKFKKGESYAKVRVKMLKANWKPFHASDSDECINGDVRCAGRPEMHVCAGTGLANCEFLWKRGGKTVSIFTIGEFKAVYDGYEFQK